MEGGKASSDLGNGEFWVLSLFPLKSVQLALQEALGVQGW